MNKNFLGILLFAATLAPFSLLAQTTADIHGKVIDGTGDALPGVTVIIVSSKMIGSRTDVTRADGSFLFRRIPPGQYEITATMTGMQTGKTEVNLGLGNVATPTIILTPSETQQTLVVTTTLDPEVESVAVTSHFPSKLIDQIAGGRDQDDIVRLAPGVTFNAGGDASISGANSGGNTWLVNGADARFDNIRSQAGDAIINDSVQETTVLTGAISAEYGQFTGGVVNTITKSGGDEFEGSYRMGLSNLDWTARTPNELASDLEKVDEINQVHTLTFGGPILKERVWFFLAGETTEANVASNFIAPTPLSDRAAEAYGLPINQTAPGARPIPGRIDEDERFEFKLTGRIAEGHDISFSWVNREVLEQNRPQRAYDITATATRTITREQRALTYTGILTPSLNVELQYSDRESVFEARPIPFHLQARLDAGEDLAIIGTSLRNQRGTDSTIQSPQFLGKPDEPRSNETLRAQFSYFLLTDSLGSHDITAGYDTAVDERFVNNRQYVNDWEFFSDFRYEGETAIPIYSPTSSGGRYQSRLYYRPIEIEPVPTRYENWDVYINDSWNLNERWRFNIGLRYDNNQGTRSDGLKSASDSILSPRLSATYDLNADGKHEFSASYSVYGQRVGDAADDGTQAGSTSFARLNYRGPQTENFQDVIQWINDTYGEGFFLDPLGHPNTAQWEDDLASDNLTRGVLGNNTQLFGYVDENGNVVTQGLSTPHTKEIRAGYQLRLGSRGFLKADFVHRDFEDFYVRHINTQTGRTENGDQDLALINNDSNGLYEKTYNAVQTSFRWRFNQSFRVSGNYTWSQLIGNIDGGSSSGILTSATSLTEYPEYNNFPNRLPTGYLPGDQRHILNLFAFYNLSTGFGNFDFALSERVASGSPYSIAWTLDLDGEFAGQYGLPDPDNDPFGYDDPDESATYYLGRGTERSDAMFETNLGINWDIGMFKRFELFVEFDIINIFNAQSEHVGRTFNTTIDELAGFDVFNEVPIEGVHYELSDNFGRADSTADYQRPRSFRMDVGIRF